MSGGLVEEGGVVRIGVMERLEALPTLITVEQICELLGLTRSAGYRAAAVGQIPTVRLGRRVLVPKPGLLRMLGAIDARDADLQEEG